MWYPAPCMVYEFGCLATFDFWYDRMGEPWSSGDSTLSLQGLQLLVDVFHGSKMGSDLLPKPDHFENQIYRVFLVHHEHWHIHVPKLSKVLCSLVATDLTKLLLAALHVDWLNVHSLIDEWMHTIALHNGNPVPTQSSTESQLSIFLPHTSMKCGNTVIAEVFCWMVGKQSLGCWPILGYDRNSFIYKHIEETNQCDY